MPNFRSLFLYLFCLGLVLLPACVPPSAAADTEEVLRQGRLKKAHHTVDIASTIYVHVRDNTNHRAAALGSVTKTALRRKGYTIVDSPSKAGNILQIVVLAAGISSPNATRSIVARGYGAPSSLSGSGGTTLVADVLLVQRNVPSAKQPEHVKLKNISRRNALSNSQMRIALLLHREVKQNDDAMASMVQNLAKEIALSLHTPAAPMSLKQSRP